jgi:hypothetical protein
MIAARARRVVLPSSRAFGAGASRRRDMGSVAFVRASAFLLAGVVVAASSCTTSGGAAPTAASDSAGVRGRIAELRERFQVAPTVRVEPAPSHAMPSVPHVVIGAAMASRFTATDDAHMRAVVDKHGVAKPATVALPLVASDAVQLEDDTTHVAVKFALRGASGAGLATADGMAIYPGAYGGSDVVHRVTAEGTEDFVVFESKPAEEALVYDVDVSRVAGLRLVSNTLEFLDEGGAPRLRVAPPSVVDAAGVAHEATLAVEGCAYDVNPAAPWGRAVVKPGASRCAVRVAWASAVYPAIVDPSWVATGSMVAARYSHTASVLGTGKVLVAGGANAAVLSSAELYDPTAGTFAATGSMATARYQHTASVLGTGKVLVAGGYGAGNVVLSSAELYDPTAGTFSATGSMAAARELHTASVLGTGKVLVAGGFGASAYLSSAELYDPTAGTFAATGSMATSRERHTASVLSSGKVLVAGGENGNVVLSSAELYDPTAGTFSATGSMAAARGYLTASVLGTGKVLVAGGQGAGNAALSSAEIYDPTAGTFSATGSMATVRDHPASVLGSGKVLVAGGDNGASLSSAELYDPTAGTFSATGSMASAREYHTASVLGSGKVLVAGGYSGSAYLSSAELYDLAPGAACATVDDCASGVCDMGICCAAACPNGNVCQACVAGTGACQTVTNASDPDNCTGTQACDATGNCKLAVGQACPNGNGDCANAQCEDGFCCNTACGGACDVCAMALGATANGTCTPAPAGSVGSPACGNGYACDGTDATCPASPCATDVDCTSTDYCASNGMCTAGKAQGAACNVAAGGDCESAPCRECAPGICNGGVCSACMQNSDCTTAGATFCVDKVCCDMACEGECQACDVAGHTGTCSPVTGAPHGTRTACSGTGTCGGACNGTNTAACTYPGATTVCATACADATETDSNCDGNGECVPGAAMACPHNLACNASTMKCATTCAVNTDCATGFVCTMGTCAPASSAPTCSTDGTSSMIGTGTPTLCAPFTCNPSSGSCNIVCATSSQCASPNVCDSTSMCVAPSTSSNNGSSGGCAMAVGRESSSRTSAAWLALAAGAMIGARRRRARR